MSRPVLMASLLLAAAAFFGWEAWRAWTGPVLPGVVAPARAVGELPAPSAGDNGARSGVEYIATHTIVARPLFRPDRRPYVENAAVAPARHYEAELARYTVLGVVVDERGKRAVVMGSGQAGRTPARPERYEVGSGDALPGFTVKEVQADGLVLMADEKEFLLPLYAGSPKAPAGGALRTEVSPPAAARPVAPAPGSPAPPPGATPPAGTPPAVTRPAPVAPTPAPIHEPPRRLPRPPQYAPRS